MAFKKWDEKSIRKEAKKYKTRADFFKKKRYVFREAKKLSILEEVCSHMIQKVSYKDLTKELVLAEALKYDQRNAFQKKAQMYYIYACKNKILDEVCSHMMTKSEALKKKTVKWTEETLMEEAKKFKKRSEFSKKASGAYDSARNLGILDKICAHMGYGNSKKWTLESVKIEAKKYKNKKEFKKKSGGALRAAYTNGWVDLVCSHMPDFSEQMTKWTIKKIQNEAKKYITRIEFSTYSNNAYRAACWWGILDLVCSHMKNLQKRLELEILHPKIESILKFCKFEEGKTYWHHPKINIEQKHFYPDFIFIIKNFLFIIEAKTCATHREGNCYYSEYENQVKIQKEGVLKLYKNKKIYHILLSESGSVCVKASDLSASLKDFLHFLKMVSKLSPQKAFQKIKENQKKITKVELQKSHRKESQKARIQYYKQCRESSKNKEFM